MATFASLLTRPNTLLFILCAAARVGHVFSSVALGQQLSYVTVKTKSPTSEERWEGPGLINGGAAHPFRLTFWGEGNCRVTSGIRANPDPTRCLAKRPNGWGRQGDPSLTRASQGLGGGECHG